MSCVYGTQQASGLSRRNIQMPVASGILLYRAVRAVQRELTQGEREIAAWIVLVGGMGSLRCVCARQRN